MSGKADFATRGYRQAAKEKNIYVTGRGFDQTKIAPDLVLTNIIEDWPGMFGSTLLELPFPETVLVHRYDYSSLCRSGPARRCCLI